MSGRTNAGLTSKAKFISLGQCKTYTQIIISIEEITSKHIIAVPDRRSRILEVVIVRRLINWVLGIWRGEGLGKG
jgi:hypothetical protein